MKTVIVLFGLLFLFLTFEVRILTPSMPAGTSLANFFSAYVIPDVDGNEHVVSLPAWIGEAVSFASRFLIAPAIWLACYFRIKEKEI